MADNDIDAIIKKAATGGALSSAETEALVNHAKATLESGHAALPSSMPSPTKRPNPAGLRPIQGK